jgi:hypothetical protein
VEPVGEAAAVDQLHDEVGLAVVQLGLVDRHDVLVPQPGQEPGLLGKAAESCLSKKLADPEPSPNRLSFI